MTNEPHPCTIDGCDAVKYFPGRCNAHQRQWEAENLPPVAVPYAGMTWVEECMAKVYS